MSKFFSTIEKFKSAYDMAYKLVLFICKMVLITDIIIVSMVVAGRYIAFIPSPAWGEEIILTLMAYMAVLSAALAIRRKAHIRMTAFDKYLPEKLVIFLDILSDIAVLVLAVVMIVVGWRYALQIGSKGTYISMPTVSRFWMYLPIPVAGVAMLIFQIEVLLNNLKRFFVNEVK
ncbi:MAG: TRAP transporter small permease [Tepidanaerobacteraceae bacterium]|jgi:TRAP-type C4-dicarboxylate transport system permease small subunit|nr:TRAP transporter small permease [Tepidanaerobacter sp.]